MTERRLLLATTNEGKMREIRALLAGLPIELVGLADCPAGSPQPEETGATFAENARAEGAVLRARLRPAGVADDSGLEIDALDGAPGIESARFGGADTTYPEKFAMIYDALLRRGRAGEPRPVRVRRRPGRGRRRHRRDARHHRRPHRPAAAPAPAASATTRSSSTRPTAARWPRSRRNGKTR